jgi:excinuclease ABC subunit C
LPESTTLREHVQAGVRNRPGVYRMLGPDDELLYVGKSVHLRTRLLSYFRASKGEKSWDLMAETARIEWEYIPNEFFALIREMKLIQQWQPRYNVQHKRRRIYSFVKVTREPAPRVIPVTRIIEDGTSSSCNATAVASSAISCSRARSSSARAWPSPANSRNARS